VAALMRASEVVVHSSTAPEPFGRVILEAMLARRPVIATRGGASAEILGEDYPYLVPPGEPASLAACIADVLRLDECRVADIVEANFTRARTLFSVERMMADIDRGLAAAA
jgi:glycosyltransferase involved in cell wall biosynthesis